MGFLPWRGLDDCQLVACLAELVLIDQHWGLVADLMGTSLYSLQAVIIDNNDIFKHWEFIVPWMWLIDHRFNHTV
jgi:hypothetical protein